MLEELFIKFAYTLDEYNSINMHDLAIISPMVLVQSVELSYARYVFLTNKSNRL